jgi:hypothetical protein
MSGQESEVEKAQIDAVFRCILDYAETQQKLTEKAARQLERHGVLSPEREAREDVEAWRVGHDAEDTEIRPEDLTVRAGGRGQGGWGVSGWGGVRGRGS